jgi:dTDP-4-dehydrorhamnose reductase
VSDGALLVTGASGLLGSYLVRAIEDAGLDAWFAGRSMVPDAPRWLSCDLTEADAVAELWERCAPRVIIHAAALTNVDLCERDPQLADAVNRKSTALLAEHVARADARLVLISTDSVFDGRRGGYSEEDTPEPVNVYAQTKLAAEQAAAGAADHLVVRTNFFGRSNRGHGLAEWILRELQSQQEITGFTDVVFSPLYCGTVAEYVLSLAFGDTRGVLHVGAQDAVSKLAFAELVAQAFGYDRGGIRPGRLADVGLAAPRPLDTSLRVEAATRRLGPLPMVADEIQRLVAERSGAVAE